MALERGRWQQENVFRFICIFTSMAPICGFVVFPFKIKGKKTGSFFSQMTVSLRSRLLLRITLLFLLGSGISLAYWTLLFFFFFPVETPEETVHWLFSVNNCLWWFLSPSFEDFQSAAEPLSCAAGSSVVRKVHGLCSVSPPCVLLARDLTRWETAQQTSVCHANYLRKSSTQVLYPVI